MLVVIGWLALVLLGVFAMQWGASRCGDVLEGVRDRYGLPATAAGALMGLATAAPETAVNVASVSFGWPDLGLGAALGSNVPALPLAFGLSYLGARFAAKQDHKLGREAQDAATLVKPQAVPVQVLPYLGVVLLLGALTLPPQWSGLQPIDGLILFAAWGAFFVHALWGKSRRTPTEAPPRDGRWQALLFGLPSIAGGALAAVIGAQKVGAAWGWSDLVVGLFVIGLLCALPEAYSAWRFGREGKPTVAVSSTTADGIVSLTIALIPPTLVGAAVGNIPVYVINLGFLVVVLSLYAFLNHRHRGQELGPGFVSLFAGLYAVYAGLMTWALLST